MFKRFLEKVKVYFAGGWINFIKNIVNGGFGIIPVIALFIVFYWLYEKISFMMLLIYSFLGFDVINMSGMISFIWIIIGVSILFLILYAIGHFIKTKMWILLDKLLDNLPLYTKIKNIINIFNSGKLVNKSLIVVTKGYIEGSKMLGVINFQKEDVVKGMYNASYNMSPLPNGGFMMMFYSKDIYVVRAATFNDYLDYLLSMGTKSISQIVGIEPSELGSKDLPRLDEYLENIKKEEVK